MKTPKWIVFTLLIGMLPAADSLAQKSPNRLVEKLAAIPFAKKRAVTKSPFDRRVDLSLVEVPHAPGEAPKSSPITNLLKGLRQDSTSGIPSAGSKTLFEDVVSKSSSSPLRFPSMETVPSLDATVSSSSPKIETEKETLPEFMLPGMPPVRMAPEPVAKSPVLASPFDRPVQLSLFDSVASKSDTGRSPSEQSVVDKVDFDSVKKGIKEPPVDSRAPRSVIKRVSDSTDKGEDEKDDEKDDEKKKPKKEDEASKLEDSIANLPVPAELNGVAQRRSMSIEEARVISLENNKDVRVLSWEPHEFAQEVAIEASVFDPEFIFDGNAGKLDEQVSSQIQALDGGNLNSLQTDFFTPEDDELGQMVLQKRLRTGGRLQVGWNADYQFNSPFGSFLLVNPAWRSTMTMKIEQPLFRGRGADIALAGIEVARADQQFSTQEFYTLVHQTLRDVEVAYWEVALTSSEYRWILESAKRGYRTWKREEKLLDAGRGSLPDALQAEEQYRRIRGDLSDARNRWGTASRELYRLLGTSVTEQGGFVDAEVTPILDSRPFDPEQASYAVRSHPEYLAQYAVVQAAQTVLRVETNSLKPDVALRFAYAFSGLAENLDDAIDIMANGNYSNWTLGVVFRHPFGRRAELANVRKAHLELNRARAGMDQIHHDLVYLYQEGHATAHARMKLYHEQFERRLKAEELLIARRKLYEAGRVSLDLELRSEQAVLDARMDEAKALSDAWAAKSELRYTLGEMHQ